MFAVRRLFHVAAWISYVRWRLSLGRIVGAVVRTGLSWSNSTVHGWALRTRLHVISSLVNRWRVHIPVDGRLHFVSMCLAVYRRRWTSVHWRLRVSIWRCIPWWSVHIGSWWKSRFINRHSRHSRSISSIFRCPSSMIGVGSAFDIGRHATCIDVSNFFRHQRGSTLKLFKIILDASLSFFIDQLSVQDDVKTTCPDRSKLTHDHVFCNSKQPVFLTMDRCLQ